MTTTHSRRGFLKLLTQVSVAIAAAPAITTLTKFIPPPAELEAVYSHLASFHEMLNEYLSTEMLMEELMRPNWLLQRLDRNISFSGAAIHFTDRKIKP